MKAVEFVRKFGLEKTRGIVAVMTDGTINYDGESAIYSDLKQIVDAFDLVGKLNGIVGAKANVREVFEDYPHDYKSRKLYDFNIKCKDVEKAISLVEQCHESEN